MTDVYLHDISGALGSIRATIEESAQQGRFFSDLKVLIGAGFRNHHLSAAGESAYDLGLAAVRGLTFETSRVTTLIYASCLPVNENLGDTAAFAKDGDVKHHLDFPASRLQAELDLRADVIGVSQQACTGTLGAIRIASSLLRSEVGQDQILCVSADRFPPGASYEQAYSVISDGAVAFMLSKESRGFRVLASRAITVGALSSASDDETVGSFFPYMHRITTEALSQIGCEVGRVDWIVPQNMNEKAWLILARSLNVPTDRVAMSTVAQYGHVISSDCLLNLKALDESGDLRPGQTVVVPMAGYGLNWQCVVLQKV